MFLIPINVFIFGNRALLIISHRNGGKDGSTHSLFALRYFGDVQKQRREGSWIWEKAKQDDKSVSISWRSAGKVPQGARYGVLCSTTGLVPHHLYQLSCRWLSNRTSGRKERLHSFLSRARELQWVLLIRGVRRASRLFYVDFWH